MRVHARQFLDEVEGGLGIGLSKFDKLGVVVMRTFNGRRIAVLDQISGFRSGGAHLLESSATNAKEAFESMGQVRARSAREWGDLVRAASPHHGPWPNISVWH